MKVNWNYQKGGVGVQNQKKFPWEGTVYFLYQHNNGINSECRESVRAKILKYPMISQMRGGVQ